jgi:hypothetical protein
LFFKGFWKQGIKSIQERYCKIRLLNIIVLLELLVNKIESIHELRHLPISYISLLIELIAHIMLFDVVLESLVLFMLCNKLFKEKLFAKTEPFHQIDQQFAFEEPCLARCGVVQVDHLLFIRESKSAFDHL